MDNELEHHGIFGMHWGVRRFQKEDGTLTEAGKKRYGSEVPKKNGSGSKKIAIGIGAAVGAVAIAAGAAYVAKKSNLKFKNLFDSDTIKELSSIEDGIKSGIAESDRKDKEFLSVLKGRNYEGRVAVREDPYRAARLMSDNDWNYYKPFIGDKKTYNFIFDTMKDFGKF